MNNKVEIINADNNNKGKGVALAAVLIFLTVAAVVLLIILLLGKNSAIMYLGVRLYRMLCTVLGVAAGVLAVGSVGSVVYSVRQRRLYIEGQAEKSFAEDERRRLEQRKNAALSVDGEMDAATVRRLLEEQSRGKWSAAYTEIYECVEQMEQMDSYQERLGKLLADNGADRLADTEDILNQVEQFICRNVRSVLNFMAVADEDALPQVKERLNACREENKALLQQTRDFIYAMADFLNDQGGKADTRLLETYRNTILSTIGNGR